jgi:hypothetical protein
LFVLCPPAPPPTPPPPPPQDVQSVANCTENTINKGYCK